MHGCDMREGKVEEHTMKKEHAMKRLNLRSGYLALATASVFAFATMPTMQAMAESSISVSLGGFFTQSLAIIDTKDKKGTDLSSQSLDQNAEIHFKGKSMLAGNTEIGLQVELEAESNENDDQIDEHYVYAKTHWGKIIIGAENGVAHLAAVTAPAFVAGLKMYNNNVTDAVIEKAYDVLLGSEIIEDAHMSTKIEHISGDANKLIYMSPRIAGTQFGVSYAPNNENKNGSKSNFVDLADKKQASKEKQENIVELSLSYSGKFNGGNFKLGYTQAEGNTVNAAQDPKSSGFGTKVRFGDVTFGVNVTTYENLYVVDRTKYGGAKEIATTNLALAYKVNSIMTLGIGVTGSEEKNIGGKVAVEYTEGMLGGTTKLAPGVNLGYYFSGTEAKTPFEKVNKMADVSLVGMTLALKF